MEKPYYVTGLSPVHNRVVLEPREEVLPEGSRAVVEFDEPNAAITPGQLAVFYICEDDMRRVAGAGWIDEATD